jgi:PAS domain S-box-containing protein
MPSTAVVPSSGNGHSTRGLKGSRGAGPNAKLAQENAKLTQENARLAQERDLLQTLIDGLPDNIFIKDRQSRFLISNLAHVRTLGAAHPGEVIGKSDLDIFPAELANQYYGDEQALMESGQPLDREETVVNPRTDEKRWLQTTKVPLRDKDGKVVGLMGINRDITGLKQAEEALASAHRELEAMLDNIPDRIYFKDTQGRFVQCNRAVVKRVGVEDPKQVIGKTDFDFYPPEKAEEFRRDDQRVIQTGEPLLGKTERVTKPNGEITWSSVTKVPLRDKEGKIVGLVGISRDITDQKQAEEALRQSHNELEKRVAERTAEFARERLLLRTLVDNLPDGIYAKDTTGRKILANPADLKNLRCKTEAEAIGKTDFDFYSHDIAEKFWADDKKVIQGEPVIDREEYFLDNKGEKHWLLTSKLPLRDPNGSIVGLVGIGRDITEHKQVEDKLAYERQLFRVLLGNTPDTIYFKDRESRFVRVSKSKAEKTLEIVRDSYRATHPNAGPDEWPPNLAGVEPFAEWLIGKTDFDTYPEARARAAYEDEQEIIRGGKPIIGKIEKATLSNGKSIWWLSTKMAWHDQDGNIIGTFGVSKDVTALKEVEEALDRERLLLRTLIDNLPEQVYAKDKQGRFVLNNLCHAKDLGAKSPEEIKGKSDFDFFPRELAEQFYNDEQNIIKSGESVINQEQYKTNPGDKSAPKRWSVASKVIWRDDKGEVLGTVGVTRDIHEMKLVQEALRHSEEKLRQFATQLERSNRELQDFAYVASHDLQEPLRKIVVFGERLREKNSEALGPEALDYLDRMQKAAGRMQTLINDLLTFSRVTTKAHPFVPVNLAEIASEVVNDLEGRIELVKGRVELGALPVVDADALQMRQLLQNLIGNALKFRRPEEPPVVKVEAQIIPHPVMPEKKLCRLTVSDNCIGFDEKYLDRIFNVFQRLHTRNEYEGTGMGLAIVRKIALHHGGDITAKSKPGQGSTFILTLPVVHPKEARDENTETTTNKETTMNRENTTNKETTTNKENQP